MHCHSVSSSAALSKVQSTPVLAVMSVIVLSPVTNLKYVPNYTVIINYSMFGPS